MTARPNPARFHLVRHAVVTAEAQAVLYGRMDVGISEAALVEQQHRYEELVRLLPREAVWLVTPLARTRRTAEVLRSLIGGGEELLTEPGLTEQDLGQWQGLPHAALPAQLQEPAHAFWPLGATETPPGGESMAHVLARVGATLERLAADYAGREIVAVSHGGAIRAAVAHAAGFGAGSALHFSVANLSLTVLERHPVGWRVVCVNATG